MLIPASSRGSIAGTFNPYSHMSPVGGLFGTALAVAVVAIIWPPITGPAPWENISKDAIPYFFWGILNGGGFPWNAESVKAKVKTLADNGLVAGDIGLPWQGAGGSFMRDIIYARKGREKGKRRSRGSTRIRTGTGRPFLRLIRIDPSHPCHSVSSLPFRAPFACFAGSSVRTPCLR